MQALENDAASLPGLNGMSRRVLVHRPVLVLDKLPTWKNLTGSEGIPLSPQSHSVANKSTSGQINTFHEDDSVETSVASPSRQSPSTSVGRKRGRNTGKGGFTKKKRIVAAATMGDHEQTSYCNDTNSEHLSDCTSTTPQLLSPINTPHFSSPSPFTVSPKVVPSSSPVIMGTVPFSSQSGGDPISSMSDTVIGVTGGLSSSSLTTITAVSSSSSSQTTTTQETARTTSLVLGNTTTSQSTDGVSHKANSGSKFVPSDKPGSHYRYGTLSSPPGCARMIPVTYIFLEESLLKRKAEKHKKKTKKLNQVTKSTPVKKEPISEEHISDQHPPTQSFFSPNGHTFSQVNIKREPITDDFTPSCLSHSTACDTRDAVMPQPPPHGMNMPLTSSPTLNEADDQGTAASCEGELECRGLSSHDHPHPDPDHSVSTRRKSVDEKNMTDNSSPQPPPPSHSTPEVDVQPSGQLHSTSRVDAQPTERTQNGQKSIQAAISSPHVTEGLIRTSLPSPNMPEGLVQTSLSSPNVSEGLIQTSLPSPHVPKGGMQTSLPSPHVEGGGDPMLHTVSEVCSQPSLLTQHFADVDIQMPVSKETPIFSPTINHSPHHKENQANVDRQLPHSLSLPQEKYSPDPKSVTVEELLSSFNDNNFQLPCSHEATNELDELLNFIPMSSHGDVSTSNPTLHASSVSLPCDTPCGLNLLTPPSETPPVFTSGRSSSSQNLSGVLPTQDLLDMPLLTPMEEAPLPVKEVEVCVERMNLKDVPNGSFNSVMSSSISTEQQVASGLDTKKGDVEEDQQGRVSPIKILRIRNTDGAVKDVALMEMEVQDKSTTAKRCPPKKKGSKWKIKNKSKSGPKKVSKLLVIKTDAKNQNVGAEEGETMLAMPKGRESDGEVSDEVQHRLNTPPVLQTSVECDACHQDSVKDQGEASSELSTKISSLKGKQKKGKDEDCLLDAAGIQIAQSDKEESEFPPVEPPVSVGTGDEMVSFKPQVVSSASNSKEEWPTSSQVVATSTPLLERGFSFNLEVVKERIASTAVIPTSNVCSGIQNENNQSPSSPIVFTLEEVIKKQQKETHQELNHISKPDEICLDGKSNSSLSTPTFSPPLSNLSSPPCQPPPEAQEDGDLLEIHPFDYQDDDMSLLGEAVQTKHPHSHPGPPTQPRNIPTTPGSSPNLGTPARPQPLLRSQVSPLFPGIGSASTRTNVPFHPPHVPHKTLPLPPPHHATEGMKSPLIGVSPLSFLPFSPPSGNTPNHIRMPMYGRNISVEQRTKEWIEDVKRCPPPPPPPPDINRNVSHDSADLDDDFASASIINEPVMTTFSSSPKEENKTYKKWRGHCRFWYSYGKCNHAQQCTLKHGPEESLPPAVATHLKNTSGVSFRSKVFSLFTVSVSFGHNSSNCLSSSVNLLFKILLKSPQELEREILITIDEAVKLDGHPLKGKVENLVLKVENLAPVIDICLAHNRSQALGKLLRFCRCIDLLPAESIVSLLKALAARKLDPSLFGPIVHQAQREQIKAVDSSTWSELLEVLCSLNHIRDIKVGMSICSQNSVHISDKTLWKLIHAFLRGPDVHAAVEAFKELSGMEDYDPSCISLLCQPLTVQKDWDRLLCVCQKMLKMKTPVRCQDLVPLFELLFECDLKQHLETLVLLVLECPAAYHHVPLGIMIEAEKRLKNHKEGQAAYQRLVDFLKFDVYDSFASQASFTPTLNSLWGYIQLFMKSDEWDAVALSLKKINPFPLSFGETLFTSLCGRLSRHKSFEKAFVLFMETLTRDVVPPLSTAIMQLVGQMGLSLLLQAANDQHWEAGFTILHQLHRHGVHYIDHTPYDNEASNQFPTKCSRMMAGVLVCVNVSPDAALEVFRGCSWQQPESGCSRDLELVGQCLPDLLAQYMNSSKHDAVQEILTHLGSFLQDGGRNMYQSLFTKYLADKQFDKAYDTCVFLMDKLKFVRKKTLVEFLSVLRSFQPRTAETTGRRKNLLNMAIEIGVFPNIKGDSPLSLSLPDQITKEEAALLVEHYVEDLCLDHATLGDLYIFFSSKVLLHDAMDYILHFFTPHLLCNRIEENDREPHILLSQSSLEAWRRANMNDSAPCSSGTTRQSSSVEMPLESSALFKAKSGGKGQQRESVVKAWQRAWRSAVQKTLNSLVQPHKKTKFKDRGDRHHFLKHLCSLYCKKIESEHKGPWVLDDSRKADLQSIVEQLMKKITLYDPASTLSLGL